MSDPSIERTVRRSRPLTAGAGLLLAGAVALLTAWLLAAWGVDHVLSARLWRVETVVAPLVVGTGALAAAWVGVSAALAGVCAVARSAGGAWRTGEVMVQRWAPGLVRRALAVAVAAGVGLGTAVGAQATAAAPPPAIAADLGWTPTSQSATPPASDGVDRHAAADGTTVVSPTDLPATDAHTAGPRPAAPAEPVPDNSLPRVPAAGADLPAATAAGTDAGSDPDDGTDGPGAVVPVAAELPSPVGPSSPTPATLPGADPAGSVVVRTGDTLWGIAARALGPGASDAEIAAEWPRWYAANAASIGPDPDVLLPGQVLTTPGPVTGGGR